MKKTKACPYCKTQTDFTKTGYFTRVCDKRKVQKYFCKICKKSFSDQTFRDTYHHQKNHLIEKIKLLIVSGVSQRQISRVLKIDRKTVRRKIIILSKRGEKSLKKLRTSFKNQEEFLFDEMETFEHTKCKPISIPLVVTKNRLILDIDAVSQPAKGLLAKLSREKYGPRPDHRPMSIRNMLKKVRACFNQNCIITTDKSPFYPKPIQNNYPFAQHKTTSGGRGCIAGYGELKKKAFDPMFALNHTAAMLRDHLATLKRRTWTTTKKIPNLVDLLKIYASYHNECLVRAV
jgi:transposase-like protein